MCYVYVKLADILCNCYSDKGYIWYMAIKLQVPPQKLVTAVKLLTTAQKKKVSDGMVQNPEQNKPIVNVRIDEPLFAEEEVPVEGQNGKRTVKWRNI